MNLLIFETLQHTATHCNTLQHTATHCVLQCIKIRRFMLRCKSKKVFLVLTGMQNSKHCKFLIIVRFWSVFNVRVYTCTLTRSNRIQNSKYCRLFMCILCSCVYGRAPLIPPIHTRAHTRAHTTVHSHSHFLCVLYVRAYSSCERTQVCIHTRTHTQMRAQRTQCRAFTLVYAHTLPRILIHECEHSWMWNSWV